MQFDAIFVVIVVGLVDVGRERNDGYQDVPSQELYCSRIAK